MRESNSELNFFVLNSIIVFCNIFSFLLEPRFLWHSIQLSYIFLFHVIYSRWISFAFHSVTQNNSHHGSLFDIKLHTIITCSSWFLSRSVAVCFKRIRIGTISCYPLQLHEINATGSDWNIVNSKPGLQSGHVQLLFFVSSLT